MPQGEEKRDKKKTIIGILVSIENRREGKREKRLHRIDGTMRSTLTSIVYSILSVSASVLL